MKAYLIDAENVSPHNFFKNYKFKKEEKNIFYIVGNSHLHFNTRCLKILSKTKYEIFTFDHPSKDYPTWNFGYKKENYGYLHH